MKISFVTSNERKLGEAQLGCALFGIEVEQILLDIEEIQSREALAIAQHKAEAAFQQVGKPLVVCDTFWNFPAYNGFPGGYMKDVGKWFSAKDFIHLFANKEDRRICFTETIVYKDATQIKSFSREFWGNIVETPRGGGTQFEQVAEFDGVTLGERRDQGGYSHDPKGYAWYDFAKWYSTKN